jgi:hypothetical protein
VLLWLLLRQIDGLKIEPVDPSDDCVNTLGDRRWAEIEGGGGLSGVCFDRRRAATWGSLLNTLGHVGRCSSGGAAGKLPKVVDFVGMAR